ncbi:MAG TPA: hypothetical protein VEK57_25580 [Thermoanaerobaculia bacterium]|nr:hypothetical protein [Thermoanaerobaculia bacterium]
MFSGYRDAGATAALIAIGIRHVDRAIALDERFAEGWMLAALLHGRIPGPVNRFARALELDANAPGVAFFQGMLRSFNPVGPAPPEGVKIFEELVVRLDADRAATGRRFGMWDAQAHAWMLFVRMASDEPHPETLRPAAARCSRSGRTSRSRGRSMRLYANAGSPGRRPYTATITASSVTNFPFQTSRISSSRLSMTSGWAAK